MMPLFNNIGSGSTISPLPSKTVSPESASPDGQFSSALESIGTAIGEMRDGIADLKNAMGDAVQVSLESDRTNQAIYDAVASAVYDSITAYHEEHPVQQVEMPVKDGKGSDVEARLYNGRGFTKSDLLRVNRPDDSTMELKGIISSMSQMTNQNSLMNQGQAIAGEDASDKKRMKDLQLNFLSSRLPDHLERSERFMNKGMSAFQKIIDGDLDQSERGSGLGLGMGPVGGPTMLMGTLGSLITSLGTIIGGGGLIKMATSIGSTVLGKIGTALPGLSKIPVIGSLFKSGAKKTAEQAAKKAAEQAAKKAGEQAAKEVAAKGGGKLAQATARRTAANAAEKAATKAAMEKATEGASKKAINKAAQKAASEAGKKVVKQGVAKSAAKMALSSGAKLAGKTALKLIPGVGLAATAADLGYMAAGAVVNQATEQAGQNVREMQAANLETFAARQEGKENGEAKVAALARSQAAEKALQEATSSFGGQVWADEKKANRALDLYKKYRSGEEKLKGVENGGIPDHSIAKKAAVDSLGFFTTSETKALADALIEKFDADREWNEVNSMVSGNEQGSPEQAPADTGYNIDMMPAGNGVSAAPVMAPGSMETRGGDVMNAGTGVSTTETMSLDAQMEQAKMASFEGFKMALMSPEVQSMFMGVSMSAGKSVEQQLMG